MAAPVGLPDALGTLLPQREQPETPSGSGLTPFAERLEHVIDAADDAQRTAETKATDFADGRSNDVHGTMIALSQADIQLRFVASLRNKVIQAYREVMRMGA